MFRFILVLLFVCTAALAQPLQGPWSVASTMNPLGVTNPRVVLRGDSIADVFYQEGNSIFRQAVSLTDGNALEPLQTVISDTLYTRKLADVVETDNGWVAAVYERNTFGNRIRIFWNELGVTSSRVVQSDVICPCSGIYCGCTEFLQIRLQIRPDRGLDLVWTNIWDYRSPTFSEGGTTLVTGHLDQDTILDVAGCAIGNISGSTKLFTRFFGEDTLKCLLAPSDGTQLLRARTEGYGCEQLGQFNGIGYPIGNLWTANRMFLVTADSGYSGHLIELVGGACVERVPLTANPATATSNENFGIAWISLAPFARSVQLTRADTAGAIFRELGDVCDLGEFAYIPEAAMTMTASGKLVMVWTVGNSCTGRVTGIMMSTIGWETPLGADEPHSVFAPSSFELSAFPNPFNSTIKIQYSLSRQTRAELSVYDLMGRKVATLFEGSKAAGSDQTSWSPEAGSGVYFVRLVAGHETRTQKILYLR